MAILYTPFPSCPRACEWVICIDDNGVRRIRYVTEVTRNRAEFEYWERLGGKDFERLSMLEGYQTSWMVKVKKKSYGYRMPRGGFIWIPSIIGIGNREIMEAKLYTIIDSPYSKKCEWKEY